MRKKILLTLSVLVVLFFTYKGIKKINLNTAYKVGQPIDSLNNVVVYYNGGVDYVLERNTKDGYNIGLKYQCVEFVKRYYYEHFNHKMPDSYGHAKSFFDTNVSDGQLNTQRNLTQYTNPSISKPKESDLIIMDGTISNQYGHVAIISSVSEDEIEIIQQNPGPFSSSRISISLSKIDQNKWIIENKRILGWLRKEN